MKQQSFPGVGILFVFMLLLLSPIFNAHAQSMCPAGMNCSAPSIGNWVYGGTYDSVDPILSYIRTQYRNSTTGNCPLELGLSPWSSPWYWDAYVGDGANFTLQALQEDAGFQTIKTQEVVGANNVWCPYELSYYLFTSSGGGIFSPIKRTRLLTCPSGYLLHETGYGGRKAYFCASAASKIIVLDPGHGLTCPAIGQASGAIGVTDFPSSNPPPGRLKEDFLTISIALEAERLLSTKYKVVLTKRDVNSCPSLKERGRIANNANARAFISIHINAPNQILGVSNPFGNGTSAIYNSSKSASKRLADDMSTAVSQNLGVNNRGSQANDNIAVLKPTVTNMSAVLIEVARLSGNDEQILHSGSSSSRAAAGIQTAVQNFLGN